jgi:hypothetical protein
MATLFKVVWADSKLEVSHLQLREIALNQKWAQGLLYCDIDGFAVDKDGVLMLCDDCGVVRYPPEGLFEIIWANAINCTD